MKASNLDGTWIGKKLCWNDSRDRLTYTDEPITMILHKKNGTAHIRWGRNNVSMDFKPDKEVEEYNE